MENVKVVETFELPHLCYTGDSPRARLYLYKKIEGLIKSGDIVALRCEGKPCKGGTYSVNLAYPKMNGIVVISVVRGYVDSVMIF